MRKCYDDEPWSYSFIVRKRKKMGYHEKRKSTFRGTFSIKKVFFFPHGWKCSGWLLLYRVRFPFDWNSLTNYEVHSWLFFVSLCLFVNTTMDSDIVWWEKLIEAKSLMNFSIQLSGMNCNVVDSETHIWWKSIEITANF